MHCICVRFVFFLFVPPRVIKDKVVNRKKIFWNCRLFEFRQVTSRAGNSNENTNKQISVSGKRTLLWNPLLIFLVQLAERWKFQNKFSCSVTFHIYNPGSNTNKLHHIHHLVLQIFWHTRLSTTYEWIVFCNERICC